MTCTGTRPLLMHNIQLASAFNPYCKTLKALNGKRNKTEEDRLAIARVEFDGGLYHDPEIGPYIPQEWLFSNVIAGAKLDKNGQKVIGGVVFTDFMFPLLYKGPRTMDGLWGTDGDSEFVDFRTVRVSTSKIDRCRPIFRQWAFDATAEIDPTVIELDEFQLAVSKAGEFKGIGDYRQLYGRYSTEFTVL